VKAGYYSPLPPERSGIADYSALLLPALAEEIDLAVVGRRSWRRRPRADVALYHIGNDPEAHGWIVKALHRRPGIVVLHDFVLHHFVAGVTLGRGNRNGYLDAMQREAGAVGRMLAHGVIDGLVPPPWEARAHEFPLTGEVLGSATGVIVHSRYVERRVRETGYDRPVWRIPHPAWPLPEASEPVGLPDGRAIVGCFGHFTPAKRLPQLLEGFARTRKRVPDSLLLLVGSLAPGIELEPLLSRYGLRMEDDVLALDYVDEARLWSLLAACQVCVGLRYPTMGETSGIAMRALTLGRPLVVSDVGWFSELPDTVAAKVPVDEQEVGVLVETLERLLGDRKLRERMGDAGCELARREHDVGRVATAYAAALEQAAGGAAVQDAVTGEVARAADEVGIAPGGRALDEIADRLREVEHGG
jgi:glycosyltransferase involved in cell wall biosynthesis